MMEAAANIRLPGSAPYEYPIFIQESYAGLAQILRERPGKLFVISQKGLESVLDLFFRESGVPRDRLYLIEQGEENKHLNQLGEVYNWLIQSGIDRSSSIIAPGGGVVGDFAGFVASTILRGVPFIQIPTTLLASVDSSVGGKVAVNADFGKNMVGSFYHPAFVYCNVSVFSTLPEDEWSCGFAEIVKHSFLEETSRDLNYLEQNAQNIRKPEILSLVIRDNVRFKASIVSQDEKETGLRSILNLGHTTAHALESITQYKKFSHGQAVSRGLVTALLLSEKTGLSATDRERMFSLMQKLALPLDTAGFGAAELLEHMKFDKKNTGGQIRFVLLEKPGKPVFGIPITAEEFENAWSAQKRLFG